MKKIFNTPLFLTGLVLRLVMLAFVLPRAAAVWYVPFLEATTRHFTLDPWHAFLTTGGTDAAFPYGYVMWLAFLPFTWICNLLGIGLYPAYGLTLLVADIGLLLILKKLFQPANRLLLSIYWLSPIVLFATYWLGYNDLIPVALLCLALYYARKLKLVHAGALCGAAISAKLSMVLAIPFFAIYLCRNRALRHLVAPYAKGLACALVVLCFPFVFSSAGMYMLLHNPEMAKVYQLVLQIGGSAEPIYLLPMVYLLMLYLTWRIRRISFELLNVLLGMSFFLVVLLTPASPGWFIWIMPLLVCYQAMSGRIAVMLVAGFTGLYLLTVFLVTQRPLIAGDDIANRLAIHAGQLLGANGSAILHTVLFTFGVILVLRIWREAVVYNDYFRLSRTPFAIGIAGDSGAGKDTLANSLQGLFGKHSVVQLSGDDYHLWDRKKPMWQVMTHLNPKANDLEQYAQDLISLTNDKPIQSHHYDHSSGQRSRPHRIESNDFIIASGLHALHLPILRSCYDLSIYLDIDEGLRRHFKLDRDVRQRGHSIEKVLSSLEKREIDSQKFVRPQMAYADLIIALQPIHPRMLEETDSQHPLRLKLFARSRHGLNEESLVRVLIGVCGLHVDMSMSHEGNEVELTIEGETSADDIALAAATLFPNISEFLDTSPRWEDGILGLMQLISLSHINQALKKRLI
ncbi:MAG: uridine kinase [Herbaspirillum sp.]|nr:uridine kinase [Herbaspirillum sp.]